MIIFWMFYAALSGVISYFSASLLNSKIKFDFRSFFFVTELLFCFVILIGVFP